MSWLSYFCNSQDLFWLPAGWSYSRAHNVSCGVTIPLRICSYPLIHMTYTENLPSSPHSDVYAPHVSLSHLSSGSALTLCKLSLTSAYHSPVGHLDMSPEYPRYPLWTYIWHQTLVPRTTSQISNSKSHHRFAISSPHQCYTWHSIQTRIYAYLLIFIFTHAVNILLC